MKIFPRVNKRLLVTTLRRHHARQDAPRPVPQTGTTSVPTPERRNEQKQSKNYRWKFFEQVLKNSALKSERINPYYLQSL